MERKAYPTDISDEEWGFVALYLTLMTEENPQRDYSLHVVIKLPNVKNGFAPLTRHWVVERSLG